MTSRLAALAAPLVVTAYVTAAAVASADIAGLPLAESQGPVTYITGGVGEDEAMAIKQAAANFALELQFVQTAKPRAEFLADVKVTIRDRFQAVVLNTATNGPFLLVNLPAGKYQIEAEYDGVSKRQTLELRAGKHARTVFVWTNRDGTGKAELSSAFDSR